MSTELRPESPRAVILDIPGDWWDSFLYAGRLYLVTLDGDVWEVDWRRLINSLVVRPRDRLALELSFIDARFIYGRDWERLMRDEEIRNLWNAKINRLAATPFEIDDDALLASVLGIYRKALPEVLSDLDIYRNRIYTASQEGVNTVLRNRLDRGLEKQWDGEPVRLRASGGMLALAAGTEGLHQASLPARAARLGQPWKVLSGDFTGCSWLSSSIYASSHSNAGALAVFSHRSRYEEIPGAPPVRTFEAAVHDGLLFDDTQRQRLDELMQETLPVDDEQSVDIELDGDVEAIAFESRYGQPPEISADRHGFSWAGHGLICRAQLKAVEMVSYQPGASLLSKRIKGLESVRFDSAGEVIDGDVAPFGVVVETEDDLVVISSDYVEPLGVRPVRWRTYHRATNYPNQLHVVADDRLRIVSFLNEDVRSYARRRSTPLGRTRRSL